MKIAYITQLDTWQEGGISKKIVSQLRAWQTASHTVRLFVLSPSDQIWAGASDIPIEIIHSSGGWLDHFGEMVTLVDRVKAWQPQLVYARFGVLYPAFGQLMSRTPTCFEINSDDLAEAHLLRVPTRLYHRATRVAFLKKAAGLIAVTHELADRFNRFNKPAIVISNGIDLAQYSSLPPAHNTAPRIVFTTSSIQPWHGTDKIVRLAQHLPEFQFDLIGPSPIELGNQPIANITAHGYLTRHQYEGILAQADVAVGTLALHRLGMNEACVLKVREYLAFGVPTIVGYRDTDFPRPTPFLLPLPNTPDNVEAHVQEIKDFVKAWQGRRVPRDAIAHLDVSAKERERLAFFDSVVR